MGAAVKVLLAFFSNVFFNFVIGLMVASFLGPEEFGRFALALAIALVTQTIVFDWLRLGAIRFYSERSVAEQPELRATLDLAFGVLIVWLAIVAAIVLSLATTPLSPVLLGLAMGTVVANAMFDYSTALARARFRDGLYARLVVAKNLLAFLLIGGGAWWFRSAQMALLGGMLSLGGSVLLLRVSLNDHDTGAGVASRDLARQLAAYSLPIVAANFLYLLIPLANRWLVTTVYGFAETGQFSLAYDIGLKAVGAIGSALDVLLFQIAVRRQETEGADEAQAQVAHNIAVVLAVLAPACLGIWLTLPSIEALIVPVAYHGPFRQFLALMLPGLFAMTFALFAVNPIFQIANRTGPVILAALIGCGADAALIAFLPHGEDAAFYATAQSGAFVVALLCLLAFSRKLTARWPRAGDIGIIALAAGAMLAVLLPLRGLTPGVLTLALQIAVGAGVYLAIVLVFDAAQLRSRTLASIIPQLRALRPR
jgi:O-antigen/teichoic acid export membrane protein